MSARSSVRVRGVTYSAPDEAYVAAAELEDRAETIAANLRRDGREAEAEQVSDRARADAERLRGFAREREAAEAATTSQPAGAPTRRASTARPKASRRAAARPKTSHAGAGDASRSERGTTARRPARAPARRSSRGPSFAERTLRRGYRRSGAQASVSSWGTLGWQAAGATIGIALLTLFISSKRGVGAFGTLANAAAGALGLVVDPIDPLARGAVATTVERTAVAPSSSTATWGIPAALAPRRNPVAPKTPAKTWGAPESLATGVG